MIPNHLLPRVAVFRVSAGPPSMVVDGGVVVAVDPSEVVFRVVSTSVTTMGKQQRRFSPAVAMSDPVTTAWSNPLKWRFHFRCDPPCRNTKTDLAIRYHHGPHRVGGGSDHLRIRVAAFVPCCRSNIWHRDIVHHHCCCCCCCCCDDVTHNSP